MSLSYKSSPGEESLVRSELIFPPTKVLEQKWSLQWEVFILARLDLLSPFQNCILSLCQQQYVRANLRLQTTLQNYWRIALQLCCEIGGCVTKVIFALPTQVSDAIVINFPISQEHKHSSIGKDKQQKKLECKKKNTDMLTKQYSQSVFSQNACSTKQETNIFEAKGVKWASLNIHVLCLFI